MSCFNPAPRQTSTQEYGTSTSVSSRRPALSGPSHQLSAPMKHLVDEYDSMDEMPVEDHDSDGSSSMSISDDPSRPATPNQSQSQDEREVNAQLNEARPFVPARCPVCTGKFLRTQERNRHVESYLPHSIYCPSSQGCTWTGRRQWDFKEHWRRKHQDAGQAPGEDANEIYDPKDFVKSIVDGTPVDEVARSAFAKVQESLGRLGKPDVGANVLGRNKELRMWIRSPLASSQLG